MGKNTFGQLFKMTSFGESHGGGIGVVIDGCPSDVQVDLDLLQNNLNRRRPGNFDNPDNPIQSDRKEKDQAEILSGVFEGKTLGTPICVLIRNSDQRSQDYDAIKNKPRKGHADQVWRQKFQHVDYRGGGRSSGRETVARVIAGSFAQMCLKNLTPELNVVAFAKQIGPFQLDSVNLDPHLNTQKVDQFHARFPCKAQHEKVLKLLLEAKNIGDSYGGSIQLLMQNVPAGLGQPVMHKLKADLGAAILSIGAVSGVNFGQHHEHLTLSGQQFHALNQPYGGIQGGISTGDPIEITIYVKPTSSILDVAKKGRHDPCIIPRVIPVVESMTHLVLLDHLLWQRTDQL